MRLAPNTAAQVALDAFNALDSETKDLVCYHASAILRLHAKSMNTAAYLDSQGFDSETELALWSQLPSDVRSALKRQRLTLRLGEQA